ncbi:rhamnogalacturonan acetylesterase [Streptomyces sp. NBC_01244]|uniref:rhamnogalacturonan acetylesterase n=1 Tax=Streptomyces sp. NBC_01244 TaxID=2903797 RepID=UPI002E0F4266|nr:rhamnogalacturonan acetylesterase [Streptomyces sp. NBC_01244]
MTAIFLSGGSSVCSRQGSMAPMTGWGQAMPLFMQGVDVINCARAGASTKSFMERGRLGWIMENIRPGDLHLISFGPNDMKPGAGLHTEPFDDYQGNLRRYVIETRLRGAHPVLVPSHERAVFDRFGNFRRPLKLYPAAKREVAAQMSAPLIDLNEWSVAWWRQLGPQGCKQVFLYLEPGEHPNYPDGVGDNSHMRPVGAVECARFVAGELRSRELLPASFFRNIENQFDANQAVQFLDDVEFDRLTKERVGAAIVGATA